MLLIDRKKLSRTAHLHAALSLILWISNVQKSISCVVQDVRSAHGKCLTFCEGVRLDETPMKMGLIDANFPIKILGFPLDSPEVLNALQDQTSDNAVFKLLQTEYTFGALVEIKGLYRLFVWRPPTPYLAMAATTSSCYFRSLLKSEGWFCLENVRVCFERVERALVSDCLL